MSPRPPRPTLTPPPDPGRVHGQVEEINRPTVPAPAAPAPAHAPKPTTEAAPEPDPVRRPQLSEAAGQTVAFAGSFGDASDAASYLGQLMDLAEARPAVHQGQDRWWVLAASIPLNLGRELVELAGGQGYVRHADRLAPDPGWGPEPQPDSKAGIALGDLPGRDRLDLVRAAGMYARPVSPRSSLVVLVPTARASGLLRRAMDLHLNAEFRPVELRPLFAPETPDGPPAQAPGTLIEIRLEAGTRDRRPSEHVSEMLIAALDADPAVLLCRAVSPKLLIQHGRHSPLTDRQLDALVDAGTWVLADPGHGCWSLNPLKEFAEAGTLIRLGRSQQLVSGAQSWPDRGLADPLPEPAELRIVRSRDRGGPVDAILLDDDDLVSLTPLLEGHPLAEFAVVVPGRDQHLLLAAGGVIERIPIGEYLTCVGPGPVYLAHGWRTEPRLPAAAWRQLFSSAPETALVLRPDQTLVFNLRSRRPVWELWAGELPVFNPQLPPEAADLLTGIEAQLRPPAPEAAKKSDEGQPGQDDPPKRGSTAWRFINRLRGAGRGARAEPLTWEEQAHEAELAGKLLVAAKMHEDHAQLERAARLYERAAFEGPTPAIPVRPQP